jgi:hypothetical protein
MRLLHVIAVIALAAAGLAFPRRAVAQRFQAGNAPNALSVGSTVPARIPWTRTEVALAAGFTAALLMDAAQTRGLARGGWEGFREANPLLGSQPTVARINAYTAVAGLTVLGVAAAAPARFRPWVLGAAFVVEALTVARNAHAGISFSLP